MKVKELYNILEQKILLLDGATGTELQKRGMPNGVCPEKWAVDNPEALIDIHREYINAGSDVVYTSTFGGSGYKLEEFGLQDKVYELNRKLAEIARKAVGKNKYVAGDIAPTGKFIEPFGEIPFEKAVDIYKEQVKALYDGGVDFFVIETMIDIQEARSALIAVKETCNLPIIVSMTFSEDERTLTGTDPISALITLQSLGAHIVGCNCSTGPDKMVNIIKKMKPYARVPLIAKPNAGLPRLIDGKTIFDMDKEEFSKYIPQFVECGVNIIGGCCGTSSEYIKKVFEKLVDKKPIFIESKNYSALSSSRKSVFPSIEEPLNVVGERINPTGKKKLQEELKEKKYNEVKRFALEQESAGASLLDVNVGMSGIDEKETMVEVVKTLSTTSKLPLVIDSSSPEIIEAALRIYPGRALVNSISGEEIKLKKLLPIVSKYGAMFILLPLDEKNIPKNHKDRIKIIDRVFEEAKKYGFNKEDVVIDGLVMTVSSDQNAAMETIKLIKWCRDELKVNSIVGLSNVSFGLPQRKFINASFLAMAIVNGLSMAICNPTEEILMNIKLAGDVLNGNDRGCKIYIDHFKITEEEKKPDDKKLRKIEELIFDCVVDGDKENIIEYIKRALKNDFTAQIIVDKYLIKAINKVGDLYDKKVYFLPQLIASAEAMKEAFNYLEPLLSIDKNDRSKKVHKIILATVKGDIHDIGKNIVGLMLKNHGFNIIDLGKDVSTETIIDTAIKENVSVIGLSALMTTTMIEMRNIVKQAKQNNIKAKIIIGGAVINQQYADEINADGYAQDSVEAVKLVKKLLDT